MQVKKLGEEEINNKLKTLQGWKYLNNSISKQFVFKDFRATIAKMIQISYVAEELNHHPDWSNVYNQLNIQLNTHDIGGVSNKDFELAERIEQLMME